VNRKKFATGLTAILILFCFLYSCTKISGTDIGADLLPVVDNINTFDTTLEISTENFIFTDSALPRLAKTVTGGTPEMLLGYISNDPQFGKSSASMYFQMDPLFYPFPYNVKDSMYFDSVVLVMRWSGNTFGDTNQLQKVNVFRLDSLPNPDSAYYTNATIPYTQLLGTKTFAPNTLNDSLYLSGQTVINQLRIRLDDAFGQELLNLDTTNNGALKSDSAFHKFLKGFAVVPDVAGGASANALMGFLISDTSTYLRVYYRFDSLAVRDTTYKTFRYNLTTGFANNITRDRSGSQLAAAAAPGVDSVIYLQTTPGSYSILRMPSLAGFKAAKGNVVIQRAEISMQQIVSVGQGDDIFTAPSYLYIDYLDTVNKVQRPFLQDGFNLATYVPSQLGGTRKYVPGPSGTIVSEYRFNIPSYIQGIVTRNNNIYPIYLYAPYIIRYSDLFISAKVNNLGVGRVKVGGGTSKERKMVLRIIYSKI